MLTELEKQIMQEITKDDFYEDELDSQIWVNCFLDNTCTIERKRAGGVLSSLIQKGLIYGIAEGRDGVIAFTELGKEYMENCK